jgi:uncharacterized protein YjbI with pentapeptide repeats
MLAAADGAVIKGGGALVGVEKPAPQQGRAAPDGGDVDWPAPAALQPAAAELPEFAKEADDLEAIKKAVDDAASVSGALWFSYLFVLFYLAVAAGAVTHADLFLENPVKLPFLGVELPLLAFFFIAPILFLVVHAYVLVHLVMLTDKAKRFHEELHKQFGKETGLSDEKAKNIRDGLRRQLPSSIFVQFLAGAPEARSGPFGLALRAIGWTTLVVGPVLLQIQFLPYHNSVVTWTQRLALLADLALVWWLWGRVLSGRDPDVQSFSYWPLGAFGLALGCAALLFSWLVATFPGEWQDDLPSQRLFWFPFSKPGYDIVTLNQLVFQSDFSETTGRRELPLSNTLVLTGFNIHEGLKIEDPDKLKGRDFVFHATNRDLKGAMFSLAVLPKVDFEEAKLQGAKLHGAQLQGARLHDAQLQGATLDVAQLQGATLTSAQLQGAVLDGTKLQGASLDGAQLQGASLAGAQLQGATLTSAQLQGATLDGAQLQGASLNRTRLQGARLIGATLQGASLEGAQLQGTQFERASLRAADLSNAFLWRATGSSASVVEVRLDAADYTPSWYFRDPLQPQKWENDDYKRLQNISVSLSPNARAPFRENIKSLDPAHSVRPDTAAWQKLLEAARVDDSHYAPALAAELKTLVCSGDVDAIYILRGKEFEKRLAAVGQEAPELVNAIMGKTKGLVDVIMGKANESCPVSASLTEADKAKLLRVKQEATEKATRAEQ